MRQRFNPATRRRRTLLTLAIAVVALGSCGLGLFAACTGTATIADLESDKANLIEVARDVMPDIAESLNGTITEAWGAWQYGGAKTIDRRSYEIKSTFTLPPTDTQEFVDAFESAGFTITFYPHEGNNTLTADIDGRTLIMSVRPATEVTITLQSPTRDMKPNTPTSRPYGREAIDVG